MHGNLSLLALPPLMFPLAHGLKLVLLSTASFLWLFIGWPQHSWPVALMLLGMISGKCSASQPAQVPAYSWYHVLPLTGTLANPKYPDPLAQFSDFLKEHIISAEDYSNCTK